MVFVDHQWVKAENLSPCIQCCDRNTELFLESVSIEERGTIDIQGLSENLHILNSVVVNRRSLSSKVNADQV